MACQLATSFTLGVRCLLTCEDCCSWYMPLLQNWKQNATLLGVILQQCIAKFVIFEKIYYWLVTTWNYCVCNREILILFVSILINYNLIFKHKSTYHKRGFPIPDVIQKGKQYWFPFNERHFAIRDFRNLGRNNQTYNRTAIIFPPNFQCQVFLNR